MREEQGEVFLGWRAATVAGVVRDHSVPGKEPEWKDKILVLDVGMVVQQAVHQTLSTLHPGEFEKAKLDVDRRDHSVQPFHFISEPREGE